MGTPASIACDLPHPQTPKSCTRKKASANIFQGVGLLQLHHLFHSSGDAQAEERAQLVWERAGNRCIAQALRQLHRKQRKLRLQPHQKSPSESESRTGFLELQHFSHLRIEDCTTSYTEDSEPNSSKKPDVAGQTSSCPASYYKQKRRGTGAAGYLHQLHQ
ncbi:arginine vasopressin-induced protein 1 [Heteronotia binoei]|uniref:arginine vasopressin-induced protein 1 n=1 Tax=Heteronotia binoei TaxID=13085 RepID=UPI00292F427F|nr:arginine vasopressin-induced protein 1 [Heteronotia binoei]